MRAAHVEGKLEKGSTPHSTTGKSPAELLFRKKLTSKMPELANVEERNWK